MSNTDISFTDDFNLRNYLEKYWRKKLLFLLFFVLSLSSAIAYIWLKIPLYQIQTTIVIKDEKKGESNSETLKQLDFLDEQKIVDNEAEIIKSTTNIKSVVQRLNLQISYFARKAYFKYIPLHLNSPLEFIPVGPYIPDADPINVVILTTNTFKIGKEKKILKFGDVFKTASGSGIVKPTKYFSSRSSNQIRIMLSGTDQVTESIKKNIVVSTPTKNSSVVNITMLHPSKEKGSEILLEIINEYNKSNIEEKKKQTDSILKLIENRITNVSAQLDKAESNEESFKAARGITTLSDDSRMFLEKVKDNDKTLNETKIQLEIVSALSEYVNNASSSVAPPNPGISDPHLLTMVNQLSQLQLEKEVLLKNTGKQNPLLTTKLAQIDEVKTSISKNLALQKSNLSATMLQLMQNKRTIDMNIGSVPSSERNLLNIVREKSIRESIYLYLLQKREEASIADAAVFSKMRIIDTPYGSTKPVNPNKIVVLLAALLIALVLPVIIINLQSSLSNKVTSKQTIENKLDLPVIAEVGALKKFDYRIVGKNKNIYAEQFRKISLLVDRYILEGKSKTILVTSPMNEEGKKLVSVNLAVTFALAQKKTVLVDFDISYPKMQSILKLPENDNFNQYLIGEQISPSQLLIACPEFKNLDVIAVSSEKDIPDNGFRVNLTDLFTFLKNNYEIIILNSPPFRIFSEPLQLEKNCDLSLLVIRHRVTTLKSLDYLAGAIKQNDFKNPLIIYNDVPLKQLYDKNILKHKYFKKNQQNIT